MSSAERSDSGPRRESLSRGRSATGRSLIRKVSMAEGVVSEAAVSGKEELGEGLVNSFPTECRNRGDEVSELRGMTSVRLKPVVSYSYLHRDRHGEWQRRSHLTFNERSDLSFLRSVEIEDEFIMNLEDHAGPEASFADDGIDPDHRDFDHVCRGTLDRHIDGISLGGALFVVVVVSRTIWLDQSRENQVHEEDQRCRRNPFLGTFWKV